MNTKRRKAKRPPEFDYPAQFDELMQDEFGEKFETSWNLFAGTFGGYVTTREGGKKLTKAQATFGRALSNGLTTAKDFYESRWPS